MLRRKHKGVSRFDFPGVWNGFAVINPGDTRAGPALSFFGGGSVAESFLLGFDTEAGDAVPGPEEGISGAFLFVLGIEEVVEGGVIFGGVFGLEGIEGEMFFVGGLRGVFGGCHGVRFVGGGAGGFVAGGGERGAATTETGGRHDFGEAAGGRGDP